MSKSSWAGVKEFVGKCLFLSPTNLLTFARELVDTVRARYRKVRGQVSKSSWLGFGFGVGFRVWGSGFAVQLQENREGSDKARPTISSPKKN